MNQKLATIALLLIILISITLLLTANWFSSQALNQEFYLGVEYAYGDNLQEMKALVDKVKNYTNLFVLGSVGLTFNRTALDEACDYIFNSKFDFIVLFTRSDMYENKYSIFDWMNDAKQKYGKSFLGIYRYQEPGGNQLDRGSEMLIDSGSDYAHVSQNYTFNLGSIIGYYLGFSPKVFTADYGLYWFDYKSKYSSVFVEFGWNHSRQLHIALGRGAASTFSRDWGAIVTWTYEEPPYLQSGDDLYNDLKLAWDNGAKYAVVFSYPKDPRIDSPYGILQEEHFEAIQRFWEYSKSNPNSRGNEKPSAVYVVPRDYGFGFRSASDTIWGLFSADELSGKIFYDTNNTLPSMYNSKFDIIYNEPEITSNQLKKYEKVFYWNQTIS